MTDLFDTPAAPRSRTSAVLDELAEHAGRGPLAFGALAERLGDRTYGLLLIVLAALNVVPFISLLTGPAIAALGVQMVLGIRRPWLPRRLLALELPAEPTARALAATAPNIRRLERYLQPRWHFSEAPIVDRCLGLLILLLGMIVTIPAPFTNLPPSFVIILIGLGLTERDGLVQVLGLVLGTVTLLLVWGLLAGVLRNLT